MDHDSLFLIMGISIGVGILFFFFTFISQKGKSGGHSFLPRPDQVEPLSNMSKPAQKEHFASANNGDYVPLTYDNEQMQFSSVSKGSLTI